MTEPEWIREDVVLAIQRRQLAEHGGEQGLRDAGLLASALAHPRNLVAYSDPKPDLAGLAAAYAFGILQNHPFVDGNKRTAYVVCRTFLVLNGHDLEAEAADKYRVFLAVAAGRMTEAELAEWLRSRIINLSTIR